MQMRIEGGVNLALKIPKAHYPATLAFYREALGLELKREQSAEVNECWSCQFGPNRLWLDRVDGASQTDVWLELKTNDLDAAMVQLEQFGVATRDELEPLPKGVRGHWISSPAGTVHLIHEEKRP